MRLKTSSRMESKDAALVSVLVSSIVTFPDVVVCAGAVRNMFDRENRRMAG